MAKQTTYQKCPEILIIKSSRYTVIKFFIDCCELNRVNCKNVHKEISPAKQQDLYNYFSGILNQIGFPVFYINKLGGMIRVRNEVAHATAEKIRAAML